MSVFKKSKMPKNLVSTRDLTRSDFDYLIELSFDAKKGKLLHSLKNKIIAMCFFEASTRTRLSFESAAHRLGANVIGFSEKESTSFNKKGETLIDTIKVISDYSDMVIIRHFEPNSIKNITEVIDTPIINAGDGSNEHPSQALIDLFTIQQKFGKIDGITIAMVGDLRYARTVHSLSYALVAYQHITIYYVAPPNLQIPKNILEELQQRGVQVFCIEELEYALGVIDIMYITRLQKERFPTGINHDINHLLTADILSKSVKDDMIVMHPLPRTQEICYSVDKTKHAWYFEQAKNGLYVRQSILFSILNQQNIDGSKF